MTSHKSLATFGGPPAFDVPLRVGQHNLPEWHRFEAAFRGIFERRFFANAGPLVRELDVAFARLIGAAYSVSVTNETVALLILLRALEIEGEIIVPALASPAVPQAVWWAGLTPVVCDVDPETFMLSPETVMPRVSKDTAGILAVRAFGHGEHSEELEQLTAARGLKLVFDATSAIMCTRRGRRLGMFGDGETFSFNSSELVNAAEGGSIVTNDETLAGKLRTIRNFYLPAQPVTLRINGKMAEAPAALALLGIEDLADLIAGNKRRYTRYSDRLKNVTGINLIGLDGRDENNYQSVVLRVNSSETGISADTLQRALNAENVFCERPFGRGLHRMSNVGVAQAQLQGDFPVANSICHELLQLPSGQAIHLSDVDRVCDLIQVMCTNATSVEAKLAR